jgi:hypothetical protein
VVKKQEQKVMVDDDEEEEEKLDPRRQGMALGAPLVLGVGAMAN